MKNFELENAELTNLNFDEMSMIDGGKSPMTGIHKLWDAICDEFGW